MKIWLISILMGLALSSKCQLVYALNNKYEKLFYKIDSLGKIICDSSLLIESNGLVLSNQKPLLGDPITEKKFNQLLLDSLIINEINNYRLIHQVKPFIISKELIDKAKLKSEETSLGFQKKYERKSLIDVMVYENIYFTHEDYIVTVFDNLYSKSISIKNMITSSKIGIFTSQRDTILKLKTGYYYNTRYTTVILYE